MNKTYLERYRILKSGKCRALDGHQWESIDDFKSDFNNWTVYEKCTSCDLRVGLVRNTGGVVDIFYDDRDVDYSELADQGVFNV